MTRPATHPKRIVIVGSEGLLGSTLVRCWTSPNQSAADIIGLDLPDFDVVSRRVVRETLDELKPDVVVNATAVSDRDYLETHPNTARSVHVGGTVALRDAAARCGALLVQISCVEAIVGDSVFAETRREAERATAECERHLIVRGSMFFGRAAPRSSGQLVETLLASSRRIVAAQTVTAQRQQQWRSAFRVVSDVLFSPTWTDDFALALLTLIAEERRGTHQLANAGSASHFDLAREVVRQTRLPLELVAITAEEFGASAPRQSATVSDSAVPLRSWQEALAAYLVSRQR